MFLVYNCHISNSNFLVSVSSNVTIKCVSYQPWPVCTVLIVATITSQPPVTSFLMWWPGGLYVRTGARTPHPALELTPFITYN